MTEISVRRLGRVDYQAGLDLQAALVEDRRAGRIGDTLLLLEHPPVITLGVKTRQGSKHIIASEDELARQGVTVHETGRGGDVTYHGPGQLVAYPIFDLKPDRCDVHKYVRDLEEVLIVALRTFGIEGKRVKGLSGVWVGKPDRERKIAAIGVRISRWITSHGLALNIATNLQHFQLIVPCGIADRGVTSMEVELGRAVSTADVEAAVVSAFSSTFGGPQQG
ncbi:MAG: lipoyl(octanoyl) transferase LipB [Acidobacteria bacterium]|nr:lipoyl(octanoyl) transferase LipB [Acidobacteriota bacterium]